MYDRGVTVRNRLVRLGVLAAAVTVVAGCGAAGSSAANPELAPRGTTMTTAKPVRQDFVLARFGPLDEDPVVADIAGYDTGEPQGAARVLPCHTGGQNQRSALGPAWRDSRPRRGGGQYGHWGPPGNQSTANSCINRLANRLACMRNSWFSPVSCAQCGVYTN